MAEGSAWSTWAITPKITGPLLVVAAIYFTGMWRRADAGVSVARWRHWTFFGGLGLLFLALQSPIDPIAKRLFSMHALGATPAPAHVGANAARPCSAAGGS